ncbi:hypothetical protein Htur_4616 (plasmid) [Haloterrigena turkmenica DSM 5511]|uniref:DUF7344 domain-containing protein n=1 Tax=Haloterrigena turkmenica (strain ATCC 51198 / DSM 5511 / JCM 9101 / NCIMB 13204 / VKM B-1734 / 4k) TaxID=543526 RepID=D2S206_HALTV|nr:hypothetical protein [Haloterrigena turkmenica]ADB63403.1 hypothetical protein Htur_4616 [Haloterrigena turkmenica DSM 5511]
MAKSTEAVTNTFSTLADPVRRYVLHYLDEQETPVSFDRLATRVAVWHTDSDPDAVDDATLTEMRTALYHMHLPKLAEASYIEWDKDTHTIRRGPNFDEIVPLLRLMADHEDELPAGWP